MVTRERDRRGDLRGPREERLFLKFLDISSSSGRVDTTLSCKTLDVSASGMRLVSSEQLPLDSTLELWVEIKGCPGKYLLNGVVKWCYPNEDAFVCGIELKDSSSVSDLADWQDLFV